MTQFYLNPQWEFDNLEEALAALVEAVEDERMALWQQGDIINAAIAQLGGGVTSAFAQALSCTRRWVQVLGRVARTFPPEMRYPDRPWELFRACADTDDPYHWLELALQNDWLAGDVRREWRRAQGHREGNVLFRRVPALLHIAHQTCNGRESTLYSVMWEETGAPRLASRQPLEVYVTVSEKLKARKGRGRNGNQEAKGKRLPAGLGRDRPTGEGGS